MRLIAVHWVLFVWSLLAISSCNVFADDWPQWLGPQRDAVWRESGILKQFPPAGPDLLWSQQIGGGYSGPAVADGRVFVLDRVAPDNDRHEGKLLHDVAPENTNFVRRLLPGKERVVCLNETNGEVLWTHEYDCPYTMAATYANGPRATPLVDDGHVYSLGAEGHLVCLRVTDKQLIWSRDLKEDYQVKTPMWGFASHPLIDGGLLYCMVGGRESTVVAFDKLTGEEVWKALDAAEPGYAPPMISEFGGERQLVVWDSDHLSGLDPATGSLHWEVDVEATYAMAVGLPRATDNQLLLMSFNRNSWLVRVAENRRSASVAWYGTGQKGIGGVMNTPLVEGGYAYGCGQDGRYICIGLKDGQRQWSTFEPSTGNRPASWANVFTVKQNDRVFLINDIGEVIIARLTPTGYEEVSRASLISPNQKIGGRTVVWSHPAFANRCIYLRNDREIRCYSLAAKLP